MKLKIAAVAAALAVVLPAAAQQQNTIGPGPITPTHLPVADTDGTPGPSAGDTPLSIAVVESSLRVNTPAGFASLSMGNPEPGTNRPRSFTITNNPGEYQTIAFTQFDSADRPTGFAMSVTKKTTFARKSPLGSSAFRSGTAALHPLNSMGYHDGISGAETGGSNFSFDTSFTHADTTGDGKPDYVSIPLANQIAIGQNTQSGGSGGLDTQVWVPITDTGNGAPQSIVLDIPGGNFFPSPPLAPAPGRNAIVSVPTLSGMGLAALSAGLLALGWMQLRRGGITLG
jgi:hypothetical protein